MGVRSSLALRVDLLTEILSRNMAIGLSEYRYILRSTSRIIQKIFPVILDGRR